MAAIVAPEASREDQPRVRFPFVLTFLVFLSLWAYAFWPALRDAWYFCDDYALAYPTAAGQVSPTVGRPLLKLWAYTFRLDRGPNDAAMNLLLRFLQGGCHVLTATLIAYLLAKEMRNQLAALAVLPFVLWSFNSEVVLIRAAGINVLAGLLSVLAVAAVRAPDTGRSTRYRAVGVGLMVLGAAAAAGTATCGLVVWAILVGVAILRGEAPLRPLLRQGGLLGLGYLLGGLTSLVFALVSAHAALPVLTGLLTKARFILHLNRLFLQFPMFYPFALKVAHALVLACTLLLLMLTGIRLNRQGVEVQRRVLLVLAVLAACAVLPYLPCLVGTELRPAWGGMYAAPLLLAALLVIGFHFARHVRLLYCLYLGLLVAVVIPYVRMARENAEEYMKCERGDRATLDVVEKCAAFHGAGKVLVLFPNHPIHDCDPYHLKYRHCDSHVAAFSAARSIRSIFQGRSTLQLVEDEDLRVRAMKQLDGMTYGGGAWLFKIHGADILAVWPN